MRRDTVTPRAYVTIRNRKESYTRPAFREDGMRMCLGNMEGTVAGTTAAVDAERAGDTCVECERIQEMCRGSEILRRVGDKWSIYVIHVLGAWGTLRFVELMRRIDGISQRMLTVTLRGLERDGLVRRTIYPVVPPRVEYTLTPLGNTLRGVVRELVSWSVAHLPEIEASRARYDEQAAGTLESAAAG